MTILEKLAINRKITAFFADGSQKMNLGIATVVGLLNGTDKVAVDVAPAQRASRLLTNLAESSGRKVEQAQDGVFLVHPGVDQSEPVVEPVSESMAEVVTEPVAEPVTDEVAALGSVWPADAVSHLAETNTALTEPKAEPMAPVGKKASPKAERKYATLTGVFFRGSFEGQLKAIYRDRETRLDRVADFKLALANGDITLPEPLTKSQQERLAALGIVS
jgi:hypothetical protein